MNFPIDPTQTTDLPADEGPLASADSRVVVSDAAKCYQIYGTPQDRLKQALYPRVRRALGAPERKYFREFWAVKGASFEVRKGETLGIIGRNGSGKSTLLQMICGTLSPTFGSIKVNGRIAALLELGAGFNPEFTGRENVHLNAALLGLNDAEIRAKFPLIEAFADIGEFIDQPVKTYSSGMYVRLAFAVVAHVDADILVIDEALAVGDAVFSQKCMRYLRKFRETGTLIFVSHDTSSVINLCEKAIWLDAGTVRMQGTAEAVAKAYLQYTADAVYGDIVKLETIAGKDPGEAAKAKKAVDVEPETRLELFDNIANSEGWQSHNAEIVEVTLARADGELLNTFSGGEDVVLTIKAQAHSPLDSPILGFFVKDRLGQSLFGEHTYTYAPGRSAASGDSIEATFAFTLPLLPNGDYSMTVSIADGDPWNNVQHHWLHDAVLIKVSSQKLRYGLVGLPFQSVELRIQEAGS